MDGTGSILKICDGENSDSKLLTIEHKSIRFLSPKEIANLHCFPESFGNACNHIKTNFVNLKNIKIIF
jgi:hypothetical protein